MVFLTATSLPLLVALSVIGVDHGVMLPENAAALVGAGVLSVAIFPFIATRLHRPAPAARRSDTRKRSPTRPAGVRGGPGSVGRLGA
jgi:hypothetical protein